MKINLKIKKGNTTETVQHEVEPIDLKQFRDSLKIIKDVVEELRQDDLLQPLLDGIEGEQVDGASEDEAMIAFITGAFETLLIQIPDHALHLLSTMSGIKYDDLLSQKLEDAFDVYDAVLEVNDIEKLIKRAKKSLAVTKSRTAFLQKTKQATAPASASVTAN